jgi:hypothetical protein
MGKGTVLKSGSLSQSIEQQHRGFVPLTQIELVVEFFLLHHHCS